MFIILLIVAALFGILFAVSVAIAILHDLYAQKAHKRQVEATRAANQAARTQAIEDKLQQARELYELKAAKELAQVELAETRKELEAAKLRKLKAELGETSQPFHPERY